MLPASLPADRVVLNTGQTIEGKIVSRTASEVVIVSPAGIESRIGMERVSEVVVIPDDEVGPGEAFATQALNHFRSQNGPAAWDSLKSMLDAEPGAVDRHESLIRRTANLVASEIDRSFQQGNPSAVLEVIELFTDDAGRLLVEAAFDDTQPVDERLRLASGRAYLQLGRRARESGDLAQAQVLLDSADEFLVAADGDYPYARLEIARTIQMRGDAAQADGDSDRAMGLYREARRVFDEVISRATNADLITQARAGLQSVRERESRIQDERARIVAAQTPTPIIVRDITEFVQEEVVVEEEPGFFASLIGETASEFIREQLDRLLPENISGDDVIEWIGYLIAFAFIFWIIPSVALKILMKRGDINAARAREKVWFLGPITLFIYLGSYIRLPGKGGGSKKGKHNCPHCNFTMDNVLVFEKLDFSHCPNCGGAIEPFADENDYIKACAGALATETEKVTMGLVSMQAFATKDTMQRLVRAVITKAIRSRASDIHVQPQDKQLEIRHRVDGVMIPMIGLPPSLGPAVISAVKVMASLDISEKRKPQDGAMNMRVDESDIDIRVATSPSNTGETASLRLLDFRSLQTDSRKLGMSRSTRDVFDKIVQEPHGLVLVCGPTGSGKTTTLYVAMRTLATGERNIISVEDPVEFRLPGVNQIQVNPTAGLTFANALRSILRQDPDVLMIGEIRDHETAEIAINAAQTGHLVFSSLHTIDAAASVTRLIDFGISERQFSMALSLVMAQRLVRLVCPDCKKPYTPSEQVLRDIGILEYDESDYQFFKGKGCDTCTKTGYHGRSGVFELLVPNSVIRSAMERGNLTTAELRELAISNGMRTLREEALIMLKQGLTTPEEVLRVTK